MSKTIYQFPFDPNQFFRQAPPTASEKKKDRDDFKTYLKVKKVFDKMEEERKKAEAEKKKKDDEKKKAPMNPWALAALLVFLTPWLGMAQLIVILNLVKTASGH